MNTNKITRVEVIDWVNDPGGRVFTRTDCPKVVVELQDDEKTLKVFILDKK